MSKVHPRLRITAGAVGAATLLMVPANVASAYDYSSVAPSASTHTSRLALITAQQSGGGAPMAAPAPLKITEATAQPPARTVTLASAPEPRIAAKTAAAPVRLEPAVLTRPATFERAPAARDGAPNLFGTKAVRIPSTRFDGQWRRVSGGAANAPPTLTRIAHVDRDEQIRQVNGWVNNAITFSDDISTYGKRDHWATAEETLRRGQGDCEDYAIAKMQLLRAAGVPQRDLHLMIVRDLIRRQDHAVLAVRSGDGFVILDSNTDRVLRAEEVRDYRPILTFNSQGAWIHGYAEPRPNIEMASAAGATSSR